VSHRQLAHLDHLFAERGWLVVALASLPLLSSKAAAIVAGAFRMPVEEFLLVTLAVRGGRFLVEGLALRFAGSWVRRWIGADRDTLRT
jgi:membrane protein YqaA with SNARE-associated domain